MESRNEPVENAVLQRIVNIIKEKRYVSNAEVTVYVNHMELEKISVENVREVLSAFIQK